MLFGQHACTWHRLKDDQLGRTSAYVVGHALPVLCMLCAARAVVNQQHDLHNLSCLLMLPKLTAKGEHACKFVSRLKQCRVQT